jgi:branched-chain amino acid transport system permease protein
VALAELLQHLVNGLSLGAVYAMIALGYTMVYGVLQLINFAHAEVFMLGAFGGYYAARWLPPFDPWPRSFVVLTLAMIACAAVGFAIERIAYRPLRGGPRLNALITAIGVSMFLQAVAQLPWFMGPSPHFFPPILPHATFVFPPGADAAHRVAVTSTELLTLLAAVTLMLLLHGLVFRTRIGRAMRAVSYDGRTASLMGIGANAVIAATFMFGSALAAAGGIFFAMNYPRIEATMGLVLGLKAFVAAVVGGIGDVRGAMVGGFAIGLVEEFVAGYVTSSYRDTVVFALLVLVLLVRPAGLFGRAAPEKV